MKHGMGVMSWYYHAVVKKFGRIGTKFGTGFLQIGASLKKARGSEREHVTFVCMVQILNTSTCSRAPKLVENHMCVLG